MLLNHSRRSDRFFRKSSSGGSGRKTCGRLNWRIVQRILGFIQCPLRYLERRRKRRREERHAAERSRAATRNEGRENSALSLGIHDLDATATGSEERLVGSGFAYKESRYNSAMKIVSEGRRTEPSGLVNSQDPSCEWGGEC